MTEAIPLAIVTSRRLPNVLKQVSQVWASRGGKRTPITLFVDGHSPEARDLSRLLNVSVVEHDNPVPPCEHSFVFCFSFPLPSLLYYSQRFTVTIVCYCSIIVPEFFLSLLLLSLNFLSSLLSLFSPLLYFIPFLSSPLFYHFSLRSSHACLLPPLTSSLFALRPSLFYLSSFHSLLVFPFSLYSTIFSSNSNISLTSPLVTLISPFSATHFPIFPFLSSLSVVFLCCSLFSLLSLLCPLPTLLSPFSSYSSPLFLSFHFPFFSFHYPLFISLLKLSFLFFYPLSSLYFSPSTFLSLALSPTSFLILVFSPLFYLLFLFCPLLSAPPTILYDHVHQD